MDAHKLSAKVFDGYTLVTPAQLGPAELDHLPGFVEKLLLQQSQEVVLSLSQIETVFSSHLTAFVQVYRLLKSFHLRFVVVDISPAVLNVMQMTQLDSLLPLYLSLDDYLESRKTTSVQATTIQVTPTESLEFSFTTQNIAGIMNVICKGYVSFGPKVRDLQIQLEKAGSILLDLTGVGYMDTRVLILVADIARQKPVEIRGASNVIRELFDEHRLQDIVKFVD